MASVYPNTWTVYLYFGFTEEKYERCTNVEGYGETLAFTRADGVFCKTTVPWKIVKEKQ